MKLKNDYLVLLSALSEFEFEFPFLTHISLASFLCDIGKQQNESHRGLFCLHMEISSKNEIKNKNHS